MLTVIDPSTGKTLRRVDTDSPEVVESRLALAAERARSWRDTSFGERAELLRAVAAQLRAHRETLARVMCEEMGKPLKEGRGETDKAAWCSEHYAEHAAAYLAEEVLASDATRSSVRYRPLGPVLGILPWNAPVWLAFRFCAPALMAGNTCLLKHDPHTPGCARAIIDVFEAAGAPEGLMQALYLATPEVEAVIRDHRVQAISFTGSSQGGAAVAAIAASEIKPAVLELGGSDPGVVLPGADLDAAADTLVLSRIINAGQSCIAAKRLILHRDVYDDMVERLEARLGRLVVGDPRDDGSDLGPLARDDLRQELHRQVRKTIDEGATCRMGGALPEGPGFFYPVTLLTDVTPEMTAFREETFGPVAVVIRAESVDDAVAMANDTRYGLGASVWGAKEQALEVADALEAGQVSVNGIVKTDPRLPSGGIKRSGYGRELGPHGIREFVNAQQLWVGPKVS